MLTGNRYESAEIARLQQPERSVSPRSANINEVVTSSDRITTVENMETRMRKAVGFIALTAGAPLVALAIGSPAAWAAPSTGSSGSTGHGATVSINGTTHGSPNSTPTFVLSTPSTGSKPNIAISVNSPGSGVQATEPGLPGSGNRAIAINSPNAEALAVSGSNNTALVVNGFDATAVGGNNTATAINGSIAQAGGSNNTATAKCGGVAQTFGNGTTLTSNGHACGK